MSIHPYRRLLAVLLLIAGTLCGQSRNELFQTSTIDALLQGVYDGEMTFAELRKHGNFGIGTFNGVDGEMIALGGRFFQISSDGKARPVRDSMRTPFASVTDFVPDITISVVDRLTLDEVQKRVDAVLPSANWYYAVRVTGRFEAVHHAQRPPATTALRALGRGRESAAGVSSAGRRGHPGRIPLPPSLPRESMCRAITSTFSTANRRQVGTSLAASYGKARSRSPSSGNSTSHCPRPVRSARRT